MALASGLRSRRKAADTARPASRAALEPAARDASSAARFSWLSAADRWWLDAYGLSDLAALMELSGDAGFDPDTRGEQVRLSLPGESGLPRKLLLKRESPVRSVTLARSVAATGRPLSAARREFLTIRALSALGFACERPLACLEAGMLRRTAALLLERESLAAPLNEHLSRQLSLGGGAEPDLFAELGREIARLHAAGFRHNRLYATNMRVVRRESGYRIQFVNLAQCTRAQSLSQRARTADLSLLLATLPNRLASELDRTRLLENYIAASELEATAGEIISSTRRQVDRLLAQRRIWEIRESDTPEHRAGADLAGIQLVNLWIDPEYRPALEQRRLATFREIMATSDGRRLRALKDRENWRLDLAHPSGVQGAFLKKHHGRSLGSWLRAKFNLGPGATAGRVEARNIARLSRAGIAAMRLIAFGEQLHCDGTLESFVLTEELTGYLQLDQFIKQRFAPIADLEPHSEQHDQWRTLIAQVAELASKFHRMGYNHRDLYCCHFFIKEPRPGQFLVNLIDLQRVEHRARWRRRWIVKDLAQLAYSAPREFVTCRQKLLFMKRYLGVDSFSPADKRLIRQIVAKQKLMEWQVGKHP